MSMSTSTEKQPTDKKSTRGKSIFFKHQKSQQNNKKTLSSKEKRLKVLLRIFNYSIRPLNRKRTAMASNECRMTKSLSSKLRS